MPLIGIKNEIEQWRTSNYTGKGFPGEISLEPDLAERKRFSLVANAFLSYLKTEKQNIIREKFNWFEMYVAK